MKYLLTILTIIFITFSANSQVVPIDPNATSDTYNYSSVDQKPVFDKATDSEENRKLIYEYCKEQLDSLDLEKGLKSFITFVIEKDGTVSNVEVSYGKNADFNKIAAGIIKNMPRWRPAVHKGEKVKTSFTIDVKN